MTTPRHPSARLMRSGVDLNVPVEYRRLALGLPKRPPRRSLRAWVNRLERKHPAAYAYGLVLTLDAALIAALLVLEPFA